MRDIEKWQSVGLSAAHGPDALSPDERTSDMAPTGSCPICGCFAKASKASNRGSGRGFPVLFISSDHFISFQARLFRISCSIKLAIAQLRIRSVTRSSLIPGAQHIISYPSVSNNYKEQDLLAHHSMLIAISEALDTALSVTHDDTTVHHRSPSIHMSPLSPFILNGLRVLSCAGMRMAVAAVAAVVRSVARG